MHDVDALRRRTTRSTFYTWGDAECCLPRGATRATLDGDATAPRTPATCSSSRRCSARETGEPADADPTHRHVVRLTRCAQADRPRHDAADARHRDRLARRRRAPFPLCVSVTFGSASGRQRRGARRERRARQRRAGRPRAEPARPEPWRGAVAAVRLRAAKLVCQTNRSTPFLCASAPRWARRR